MKDCPNCGEPNPVPAEFCVDCGAELNIGNAGNNEEEHYAHLFGDVYWDTRSVYTAFTLIGVILLLLPVETMVQIMAQLARDFFSENRELTLWWLRNYQIVGFACIGVGILGPIKLRPSH